MHLADEGAHAFDATNGLLKREDTLEHREESEDLGDAERSAAAAIISGGFSAHIGRASTTDAHRPPRQLQATRLNIPFSG